MPAPTAVTNPPLVTVATAELLLIQVPPLVGDNVDVWPTQILEDPVTVAMGFALKVIDVVGSDAHKVELLVKIKNAEPADMALTTPALVTVATVLLLLDQVPPEVGDRVVVEPTHKEVDPVILIAGFANTSIILLGTELHPVEVWVKVNVAVPALAPVTTPALVTVAIEALLLTQVPPVVGVNIVVKPTHTELAPLILIDGLATMVIALVGLDVHAVDVCVKVNVTVPALTPVTTPALVTVAIEALLLNQVPPLVGESVVVAPSQIEAGPVMPTTGIATTVIAPVAFDVHPVED